VHRADNLATFVFRFPRNSESHNLLSPEGTVQACNGIALRLAFMLYYTGQLQQAPSSATTTSSKITLYSVQRMTTILNQQKQTTDVPSLSLPSTCFSCGVKDPPSLNVQHTWHTIARLIGRLAVRHSLVRTP
jgi:hypothetical protein